MSSTLSLPAAVEGEQCLELTGVRWEQYLAVSDAFAERSGLRINFRDGRLTLLTKSRRHEWYGRWLGDLVVAVASGCDVPIDYAGETTYRREDLSVGAEGDDAFYLGENASIMAGPQDVGLSSQPPPDLVLEIELSHSADEAMVIWGRIGVPEVWRYDPQAKKLGFLVRKDDGTYSSAQRSLGLPMLETGDVLGQLRLAEKLGTSRWLGQLAGWVHAVLRPRLGQ